MGLVLINAATVPDIYPAGWKKVGSWAEQETGDYQLPKELEKFRQSVLFEKNQKG